MPKPVTLAALGISIVVAGVSLGVTLTRYLGLRAYIPKDTAQAASTAASPVVSDLPPEEWNNLFSPRDGMKMASRIPATTGKTASQAPRSSFVLVGTIVSSTPSARRAILWASGMKQGKAFAEKEEVEPGAILASVERDKVWITRGGVREKLEILPVGSRGRPTATSAPAIAPSVAGAATLPAFPTDASTLPWAAPGSTPGVAPGIGPAVAPAVAPAATPRPARARASAAQDASSDDEDDEHLSARQRRRRAQGLRR